MGAFCILSQNNGGVGAGNDIFGKLSQAPPPVVLRSIHTQNDLFWCVYFLNTGVGLRPK